MFEKVFVVSDSLNVSSEGFHAIDVDNAYTALIVADKDILEVLQSLKNIIKADSVDENKMTTADPVPTSSEMRNVMKSIPTYLDEHSNGEMNNKMDDIE
ncbi:hypothetical protein TNCV_864451 [Trichonephila clavipes]|nr:hypothetical protein TNCV_864451 [Trichonephila clavipes]